jgi:hypothetical protein
MTFRERFDRWFCRAGWHTWGEYVWSTDSDRVCRHCGTIETLRIVDAGRSRCWVLKPTPPKN